VYGASSAWDVAVTQNTRITFRGNLTFPAFNNPVQGGVYILRVKQDGVGVHTVTWPAIVSWPYGLVPVLSVVPNEQDLFTFYYDGAQFLGGVGANYPV